ncbi:MAG: peptidylprolyl isomerase [Desulfonatronovibrionaceae bacterium]
MKISSLRFFPYVCLSVFLLFSAGCGEDNWEPGVVARVNGEPIYLRSLEAKYDFEHFEWSAEQLPQTKDLKSEYRGILVDLIIQRLVEDQLEEMGLAVSKDEVLALEREIRKDYPEGEFENILVEEYVDLNYWREQVKAGLQWQRFEKKYLRPRAEVEVQEIKEYYRDNAQDFYVPKQVHFLLVAGPEADMVQKALEKFESGVSEGEIKDEYGEVNLHEYSMHEDQVPSVWSTILKSLEPGQSSQIKNHNNKFYALHVLSHEEEKILEPYQAYTVIEEKLMHEKERAVFLKWLKQELKDARIEFSSRLKEER